MNIYKIKTDAVLFSNYFLLAENISEVLKKAKSVVTPDEEIRDIEFVGFVAEKAE